MTADGASVLVQRRRLVAELKKARLNKGETQGQIAGAMEWSLSKVQRIEKGASNIKTNDLKVLLQYYGVTDKDYLEQLLELGREARREPWWHEFRNDVPKGLITLIEYESASSVVRQFEASFVPGILQTEEYARTVLEAYYNEQVPASRISAMVELRTRRRQLLDVEDPPRFHFVIDEPVARRIVGNSSIMREQIRSIIDAAGKPNVTVGVVPFTAGLHSGMKGQAFEFIEFAAEVGGSVVFEETPRGDVLMDKPEDVMNYLETFEQLDKISLSPRDSLIFLGEIYDEMK
jgi:transcriptional regulator with XRE-family HTH domain